MAQWPCASCCYLIKQFNNEKRNVMQNRRSRKVFFGGNGISCKKLLKAPSTSITTGSDDDEVKKTFFIYLTRAVKLQYKNDFFIF